MPCWRRLSFLTASALAAAAASAPLLADRADTAAGAGPAPWPQFRGPRASGMAEGSRPPLRWDAPKAENLRWKTPVPGLGHASPIVWGERVFIVTAVSARGDSALRVGLYGDIEPVDDPSVHEFRLLALDRRSGRVLWDEKLHQGVPRVRRHPKSSHANSTPATDGEHLVVFLGSEGLHSYALEGKLRWRKDLGLLDSGFYRVPGAQWGFGSSPVIHRNLALVQCDVQKGSFLAAYDLADGREVWRTPRDDVPTWSTPTVHEDGAGRALVIVNGYRHSGAYDALTGKEIWRLRGGGDIPVPTPVVAGGLVFLTSAHGPEAPLRAVRLTATGEVTAGEATEPRPEGEHLAWSRSRDGAYMQTPLVHGDLLYVCRDNGVLSCHDARSGERLWRERLGGGRTGFTASPVAARGRLYFTSEEGEVHVVEAGPALKVLAVNPVGEVCLATPALSGELFIVRARSHVYAFAGGEETPSGKDG